MRRQCRRKPCPSSTEPPSGVSALRVTISLRRAGGRRPFSASSASTDGRVASSVRTRKDLCSGALRAEARAPAQFLRLRLLLGAEGSPLRDERHRRLRRLPLAIGYPGGLALLSGASHAARERLRACARSCRSLAGLGARSAGPLSSLSLLWAQGWHGGLAALKDPRFPQFCSHSYFAALHSRADKIGSPAARAAALTGVPRRQERRALPGERP